MQKVIGLDIGSYSIKAVEIINTFKSYEITNFYENVIPHLDDVPHDAVVPSCMEQLFSENNLSADRILTAMPGQFISSRILPFNFADPSKIEKAVFVEVEDAVPFNMDDMIMDHQILGQMGPKTFALAVLTRKVFLKNFLDLLQRIDIDPKLVDVDSLAFYNLSSYLNVEPNENFAMVDVGHEKTSLCIMREGHLRMFRSINLGGKYVTEFLARDLEVSFTEAQRIKHRISRIVTLGDPASDLTGDDKLIADRMTLACNAIVRELGRTFYAFKTWEKTPIKKVFLSGGTSKIANFGAFLDEQLDVEHCLTNLEDTSLNVSPNLGEFRNVMPQSVAIGIRTVASSKRHSQVNLRQGEFAYVQNYENVFKYAKNASKVLAFAMSLLLISYVVKHMFYTSQIDALKAEYKKELFKDFPKLKSKLGKPTVAFKKLRKDAERQYDSEIKQRSRAIKFFVGENSGSPSLVLLKIVSESIPKEVKVDITNYKFKSDDAGGGKVEIKGETDNYDAHSQIVKAIQSITMLDSVKDAGTNFKPGSNQKILQFRITAEYLLDNSDQS